MFKRKQKPHDPDLNFIAPMGIEECQNALQSLKKRGLIGQTELRFESLDSKACYFNIIWTGNRRLSRVLEGRLLSRDAYTTHVIVWGFWWSLKLWIVGIPILAFAAMIGARLLNPFIHNFTVGFGFTFCFILLVWSQFLIFDRFINGLILRNLAKVLRKSEGLSIDDPAIYFEEIPQ